MKHVFAISMVLAFLFVSFPVQAAETPQKNVTIRDGVIYFSEQDNPEVILSKLKFNVPPDTPKEILDLKDKIFRGENTKAYGSARYFKWIKFVFLLSFDPGTNAIAFYYVYGAGPSTKPGQDILKGTYTPGSSIELERGSVAQFDEKFKIEIQKDKLKIDSSNGWGGFYLPVAKFP